MCGSKYIFTFLQSCLPRRQVYGPFPWTVPRVSLQGHHNLFLVKYCLGMLGIFLNMVGKSWGPTAEMVIVDWESRPKFSMRDLLWFTLYRDFELN